MSISPFASVPLLIIGTACAFFSLEPKDEEQAKTKDKTEQSSKDAAKLDSYLLMIKGVKKGLKYSKKAIKQVQFFLNKGFTWINFKDWIRSPNLSDWIRSPKAIESMILVLGTIGMVYSNFKSFKEQSSLFSKVTTIGESLLSESRGILTMHQLMTGISDVAKNRKPPIKELTIAGAMILASNIANRYSK